MAADRKGECWAVVAASEQGKGVWIKQQLKARRPARLLIWDRVDEYAAHATKVLKLADLARQSKPEKFALRYVPRSTSQKSFAAEFDMFCRIAFAAIGATILVEELSDVTSPSYAPPAWRRLNSMGRHHQGLTVIGCSQSPASIDKTFLGNATLLHVGFIGQASHRRAVAAELDINPEEIRSLKRFQFVELDRSSGKLSRGSVTLRGSAIGLKVVAKRA